jgi:hypothetical protein
MAESRKRKRQQQRKADKEERDRELARDQFRKSLLSYAGRFFGGLIGIATLYTLLFQVPASFSPSSQALLSATNPFSTQFTFTNDGLVAAYQVEPKCLLNSVTSAGQGPKIENTFRWQEKDLIPFVSAKDRFTVPCRFLFGGVTAKTADISLTFSYRSLYLWRSTQSFRFVLNISDNGTAIWLQQPVQ